MKNKISFFLIIMLTFIFIGCGSTNNEIYNRSYDVNIDINEFQYALMPAVEKATEASVSVILYEQKIFGGTYSAISVGSGVIYSAYATTVKGEIIEDIETTKDRTDIKSYTYKAITNEHVLNKYTRRSIIQIYLGDLDLYYDATLLGKNIKEDLAVITFTIPVYITPIKFGNSDNLKQGEFVVAVGNPEGINYYLTATFGIVSFPKRYIKVSKDTTGNGIEDYQGVNEYIQIDAPINPGNSGGALVNIKGDLIGINTMKIMDSEDTIEGLGFAIPINVIIRNLTSLESNSTYEGIEFDGTTFSINEINSSLFEYPNITVSEQYDQYYGVYILDLKTNNIGLLKNDIIMEIDNNKITSSNMFYAILKNYEKNEVINYVIFRNNKIINLEYIIR